MPAARKPSQSAPRSTRATGAPINDENYERDQRGQQGSFLTTVQGVRLPDTDHSLKVGSRGPTLLEDFHLREKITHFDHERIPERVVHARGAAAHGVLESYANASAHTRAKFLGRKGSRFGHAPGKGSQPRCHGIGGPTGQVAPAPPAPGF